MEQVHLRIEGRVQGVGFRYHTEKTARQLGLVGWVRNLPDGSVETWAEGPKDRIETFVAWCHEGPASSRVSQVAVLARAEITKPSLTHFETR